MPDQRILDSFFQGAASECRGETFSVEGHSYNLALQHETGHQIPREPTQLLFTATQGPISLPIMLAAYAQDRRVGFLHLTHPEADAVAKELSQMELYPTAETKTLRMYCPIACEDCELALRCSVASEEDRMLLAKPRLVETDGPLFF